MLFFDMSLDANVNLFIRGSRSRLPCTMMAGANDILQLMVMALRGSNVERRYDYAILHFRIVS